jgi:hypothetical protein
LVNYKYLEALVDRLSQCSIDVLVPATRYIDLRCRWIAEEPQVTFETRSKEQVYADILAAGKEAGFVVVPEFMLHYNIEGRRRSKKTDVARELASTWLQRH